jgi:phage baseplate assembly protein W
MTITYRGFSTLQSRKNYVLTDFELARQDLINYFNIRRGEKLMQPSFGSIIWDQLFEPLDEATQQLITADVTKIVSYDPRLSVGQVAVTQEDHGFLIQLTLAYVPTNQQATLMLNFDRRSQTLTTTTRG